ncbi:MAG: hypothetical protein IJO27_03370 [Bacilli bacterium]|nr:hypothetical protein [Bacilli bacterium]
MNNYLIPANAKKSLLILGFFTTLDLVVFSIGAAFTIIMLLVINSSSVTTMILILMPLLISATLVMPVPYYHNVMQLIINIFNFFLNQRRYKWKGWCISSYEEQTK